MSVGGGVQWARPNKPFIWPLDGCKWSRFKIDINPSKVQAAQAGGPPGYTMEVKRGEPSPAIQLNGAGDAPTVTVTGPGGQLLSSTDAGVDYTQNGDIRIVRFKNDDAQFTTVGLQDAKPGTYTVALQPGSPAVTGVERAEDPVDAKASGKVTGKGARRTLEYDVVKRADQTVTFYDSEAKGNEKAIGTITGGGRGKLAFKPAPGRTIRKIVARFTLNGIDAEEKTVTRFRPPSPTLAKPTTLRVRRAKGNSSRCHGGRSPARRATRSRSRPQRATRRSRRQRAARPSSRASRPRSPAGSACGRRRPPGGQAGDDVVQAGQVGARRVVEPPAAARSRRRSSSAAAGAERLAPFKAGGARRGMRKPCEFPARPRAPGKCRP